MSSFSKIIYEGRFFVTSECQRPDNNTKATQRKQQVVSLREGKFYCIYLINENGQKDLLVKIPINRIKKRKLSAKPSKYNVSASSAHKTRATFKYKLQMLVAVHDQNAQRMIDILNRYFE